MTLTLMHCQPDLQRLSVWAARRGYLSRQGDLGYALHALLNAAFGEDAPQPFYYLGSERGMLAYSPLEASRLQQISALAPPDVAAALGLDATTHSSGLQARRFPEAWLEGQRLDFEVRVRPVVRSSQDGRERDAYLQALEKLPEAERGSLNREAVYLQWLAKQLTADEATAMLGANMTHFQLSDVIRQTQSKDGQPRRTKSVSGPEAVFKGQLEVKKPAAFAHLVQRGIGRHLAFGFGMLMLKPTSSN